MQPRKAGRRRPRPEKRVKAPILVYDLERETRNLRQEDAFTFHGHNAITLVKRADGSLVLIRLERGGKIDLHSVRHSTTIHTLTGFLRVRVGDRIVDLPAGRVVCLAEGVPHEVEAIEETTLLYDFA